jgi:hypothetical protein
LKDMFAAHCINFALAIRVCGVYFYADSKGDADAKQGGDRIA